MAASPSRIWVVTASESVLGVALVLTVSACSSGAASGDVQDAEADSAAVGGDSEVAADTADVVPEGDAADVEDTTDVAVDTSDAAGDGGADADDAAAVDAPSDVVADATGDVAPDAEDTSWLDVVEMDAGDCPGAVSVALTTSDVSVWTRQGEGEQSTTLEAPVTGTPCGGLRTLSSAPWLSATWREGTLDVMIAADAPAGRLEGQVALVHGGEPGLLAMVDVVARVFPDAEGEPRVLFIGVDGMRSDAMLHADTPTFDGLRQVGAWTLDGRTHDGTTDSSVGWTSLFTGVQPARHGVLNNGSMDTRDWSYPTFAWIARDELDARTSMVAHWVPAAVNLHEEDAFDDVLLGDDAYVASSTAAWLREGEYDLWMTHFDDVDHAGHASGFSPVVSSYIAAIEQTDAYADQLIDALLSRDTLETESWLVVLVTDHGGEGTSHGAPNLPNQRVPFVFSGSAVPLGELMGEPVTHMDVAPTILAHLGYTGATVHGFDGVARAGLDDIVDPDGRAPSNEMVCDNRIDEDGDALLDCDDDDCDDTGSCAPVCAEGDLASAVGAAVATGSNVSEDTDFSVTCARLPGAADVSFRWASPASGRYRIDTVGSSYDTILAVYEGECPRARDQVACNDDSDGLQSAVDVDTEAGTTYSIVVSGFDGRTGDWVLNIAAAE